MTCSDQNSAEFHLILEKLSKFDPILVTFLGLDSACSKIFVLYWRITAKEVANVNEPRAQV